MSHAAEIKVQIKDLAALELACRELGLELTRNQKTYAWYGRSMGDGSLPEGFTEEEIGHCEHAIKISGTTPRNGHGSNAYEIGVVKSKTGPGYVLHFDHWGPGQQLAARVGGNEGKKLAQVYAAHAATRAAQAKGLTVARRLDAKGNIILTCTGAGL